MRFLSDITIEHAIAHHLDHLTPEKILSKRGLKLSDTLHLYLIEHIMSISRISSLVPARFVSEESEVSEACRKILSSKGHFVPLSVQIAERLFTVMGNNRSLSPGLLLVVQAKNNENQQKFIAIMKMESQPVFKEERLQNDQGEPFIELTIDPVALPAPGRHLQKCALIKLEHTPAQPEILLIDRQARDTAVAGFFHEKFLQAEACRDSHFRTKKFVKEFVKWANKARQEHRITPDELDMTVSAARQALRHEKLSVPDVIEKGISNRGEQHHCLEYLTKQNVDPKFETELKASERFRKTHLLKLDHGTQIRMPHAATLNREFYSVETDPEDQTVSVVTFRTRKFQMG